MKNLLTDKLPLECDDQILGAATTPLYLLMMTISLVSSCELSRYKTLQYLILHLKRLKYLCIPEKMCMCMYLTVFLIENVIKFPSLCHERYNKIVFVIIIEVPRPSLKDTFNSHKEL